MKVKDIKAHLDSIIDSVKNNANIVFSTKEENTTHYDIFTISKYKFTFKREKKVLINDYYIIIEKSEEVIVNYKIPFIFGKLAHEKITRINPKDINKELLSILEKAKSFIGMNKNDDDIIDINDLSKFK